MEINFVNEENLLKNVKYFFNNPQIIIKEAIQNTRRAGADKIIIGLDKEENKISISNNGKPIKYFTKLLVMSESGWDKETMDNEMPAGWGVFSMLSVVDQIRFYDEYADEVLSIAIDSKKFLHDKKHREEVYFAAKEIEKDIFSKHLLTKIEWIVSRDIFDKLYSIIIKKYHTGEFFLDEWFKDFIELDITVISDNKVFDKPKNTGILIPENEFYPGVWSIDGFEFFAKKLGQVLFNGEKMGYGYQRMSRVYTKDTSIIKPVLPFREDYSISEEDAEKLLAAFNHKVAEKKIQDIKEKQDEYKNNPVNHEYTFITMLKYFIKNIKYFEGFDLNFLEFYIIKKYNSSNNYSEYEIIRKDEKFNSIFPESIFEIMCYDGSIIEPSYFYSSKSGNVYHKNTVVNEILPEWIKERFAEVNKKYENLEKVVIDVPKEKFESVQGSSFSIIFIDKTFLDLKGYIIISDNRVSEKYEEYKCSNAFIFCNKEDKDSLACICDNTDIFELIYFDDVSCDSYSTQSYNFEEEFSALVDDIFPEKLSLLDALAGVKIEDSDIVSVENHDEKLIVKTKEGKHIDVSKCRKSIVNWRF